MNDERFATPERFWANAAEGAQIIRETIAERPLAEGLEALESFEGQWTVIQDTVDVADDPEVVANGYLAETVSSTGRAFRAVTTPVQFDRAEATPRRAPQFNEDCFEILAELGIATPDITRLQLDGVLA